MTKNHELREKAELLLGSLTSMHNQLTREIDSLNNLCLEAQQDYPEEVVELDIQSAENIVRKVEVVEATLTSVEVGIRTVLGEWTLPEMPALDFSNVPAPVLYER